MDPTIGTIMCHSGVKYPKSYAATGKRSSIRRRSYVALLKLFPAFKD